MFCDERIAELESRLAAATERAERAEWNLKCVSQSSQQNAINFRHAEVLRIEAERRAERAEAESAEYIRTTDPLLDKMDEYLDRAERAEAVLRNLVDSLVRVAASPEYRCVWDLFAAHGGKYVGPEYGAELDEALTYFADKRQTEGN